MSRPYDARVSGTPRADSTPGAAEPGGEPLHGLGIRSATFQDHDDPAFPRWLPLPGLVVALLWALYQGTVVEGHAAAHVLRTLAWPGAAIFLLTTVTAYFGWRLDLD